jgi:hypothetical protein
MKMKDDQIKHMVNRFLGWQLPENFNPDGGVSFKKVFNENTPHPMKHEPTGTNLFDAVQAEEMVRYMVEGIFEEATASPVSDRAHLQVLLAQAITARLKEEVIDEILPKPSIAELEKMIDDAEKEGKELGRLMPSGEIMRSHSKPVFASDLADAVLSALQSSGFEIVSGKQKRRTVLDARSMCRPGDEPLA